MSLIHKFLEKKVFINDCNNAKSVSKRQVKKALTLLKQGKYQEIIDYYNSKKRIKKSKYNKYKYYPLQDVIKGKKVCTYQDIDPAFYVDFDVEHVVENADFVFIDKLLHTLDNSQEVVTVLNKAAKLLNNGGCIVIKECFSSLNMMEVVDFFNLVVTTKQYTLQDFQNTTGMYLAFAEWKQLFEEVGYTVVDSKHQNDMYNSFYMFLKLR